MLADSIKDQERPKKKAKPRRKATKTETTGKTKSLTREQIDSAVEIITKGGDNTELCRVLGLEPSESKRMAPAKGEDEWTMDITLTRISTQTGEIKSIPCGFGITSVQEAIRNLLLFWSEQNSPETLLDTSQQKEPEDR